MLSKEWIGMLVCYHLHNYHQHNCIVHEWRKSYHLHRHWTEKAQFSTLWYSRKKTLNTISIYYLSVSFSHENTLRQMYVVKVTCMNFWHYQGMKGGAFERFIIADLTREFLFNLDLHPRDPILLCPKAKLQLFWYFEETLNYACCSWLD